MLSGYYKKPTICQQTCGLFMNLPARADFSQSPRARLALSLPDKRSLSGFFQLSFKQI
jgi:hypothetical protein